PRREDRRSSRLAFDGRVDVRRLVPTVCFGPQSYTSPDFEKHPEKTDSKFTSNAIADDCCGCRFCKLRQGDATLDDFVDQLRRALQRLLFCICRPQSIERVVPAIYHYHAIPILLRTF